MNNNRKVQPKLTFAATWMLLLLLSACNMPLQGGAAQEVNIVAPEDGAQLQSGVTIDVQASFSLPGNASAASLIVNQQAFRRDAPHSGRTVGSSRSRE